MAKAKKQETGAQTMQTANTASVVDGKLILSFPLAVNPVIWQMDLNKAKSCALEIKEDKKAKSFILCLKTDSQDAEDIAAFESKEQAVEALMSTSAALQGASGRINPVASPAPVMGTVTALPQATTSANPKAEANDNKKAALIAFALVVVLVLIWSVSVPRNAGPLLESGEVRASGSPSATAPAAGVPVSADDFLFNRR